jgi:ribonuclease BN (tRNA processing enzyme)
MKVTVVGCGDAFGSGGRLQTCYHVATAGREVLLDCGATALIGLQRLGLDPNRIETIFVSHLHGDHFAGLVWFVLHAHHVSRRTAPLTVTGPAGIARRFEAAAEALFPGTTTLERRFDLTFLEYSEATPLAAGPLTLTPFEVRHPSGAPPYALRLEAGGKVLGFSGDTEWVESLVPAARDAGLFIAECYGFAREVRWHMNWRVIESNLDRLGARRVMLTHMNADMLANAAAVRDPRVLLAADGMSIEVE